MGNGRSTRAHDARAIEAATLVGGCVLRAARCVQGLGTLWRAAEMVPVGEDTDAPDRNGSFGSLLVVHGTSPPRGAIRSIRCIRSIRVLPNRQKGPAQ
ncbi:hypothetical protein rosag_05110 [Roseisolibacter agri]|uniref:Uncharacterized protein n=1 Tax=Roseisolibacter agri TaxID=2014610 RepID=A0AA37V929_9BACT|nr:hypothetical protein rosag_05110 [Roseisolibacter agri]